MPIISLLEDCFEFQLLILENIHAMRRAGESSFGIVLSVTAGLLKAAPSKDLGAVLDQAVRFKSVTE